MEKFNKFIVLYTLIFLQGYHAFSQTEYAVGTSNASVSVSKMGAAISSFPIYCPPGRMGKVPQLAFSFSSQSGPGMLGQGFNIEGLSAISLSSRNFHLDGEQKEVQLDGKDLFVLDGARLILTSGSQGQVNSMYRTEQDIFARIIYKGDYFEVQTKDGGKLFYGDGNNSSLKPPGSTSVISWYLYKSYDKNGNYISYEYSNTNGEILLTQINYTGFDCSMNGTITCNETAEPTFNKVVFHHQVCPKNNFNYVGGYKLQQTKRVDYVQVYSGLDKIREYKIAYTDNSINSFVESITEHNRNKDQYYPVKYKWEDDGPDFNKTDNMQLQDNYIKRVGDFDGDGKSDILIVKGKLEPQNGFFLSKTVQYEIRLTESDGSLSSIVFNSGNLPFDNISDILIGDLNEDGKDDLLYQITTYTSTRFDGNCTGKSYTVYSLNIWKTEYHATISSKIPNIQSRPFYEPTLNYFPPITENYPGHSLKLNEINDFGKVRLFNSSLGDLDGDGKIDLIYMLTQYNIVDNKPENMKCGEIANVTIRFDQAPKTYIYAKISTETASISYPTIITYKVDYLKFVDFNGNGKMDIMVTEGLKSTFLEYVKKYNLNGSVLSKQIESIAVTGFPTSTHKYLQTGDFNGDRITDYLCYSQDNKWRVSYGTGKGFNEYNASDEWFLHSYNYTYCNWGFELFIADVNGDGKDDIIERHDHLQANGMDHSGNSLHVYYSKGLGFYKVYKGNYPHPISSNSNFFSTNLIGDFNADGKKDLLLLTRNSSLSSDPITFLYFNTFSKKMSELSIRENIKSKINYSPITRSTQYFHNGIKLLNEAWQINIPITVVENLEYIAGTEIDKNVKYYYSNLYIHRHGRGLMGFERTVEVQQNSDANKKNTILNIFGQNKLYTYQLDLVQTSVFRTCGINANGMIVPTDEINRTDFIYTQIGTTYQNPKIYFQFVNTQTETDYLTHARKKSCFDYDINGNLIYSQTKFDIYDQTNSLEYEETKTFTYGKFNSFIPSSLTKISNNQIRYENTVAKPNYNKDINLYYYNNGNLWKQTDNGLTQHFNYDKFGNNLQIAFLNSSNNLERITNKSYSNGRFLQNVINPLGQTSSMVYEPIYGNKISETGVDGLTTTFEYNNWGSSIKTIEASGNWSQKTIEWPSSDVGITFYRITTSNNLGESKQSLLNYFSKPFIETSIGFNNVSLKKTWTYNNNNELIEETNVYDANNSANTKKSTLYTYDTYGRPKTTKFNSVTISTVNYNQLNTEIVDGKGNKKTTKKGPSGTTLVVTDAAGNEIKYHLGSHNLPLSIEGGGGTITTDYNSKLQRIQMCDPNTGCTIYTYDKWGNLTSQTDAKGQQYIMEYDDNINRLTRKYIDQTLMGDKEEYIYNYFNTPNSTQINQLNFEEFKINNTTKHKLSYEYKPWGGLYKTIEIAANSISYTTEYGYDNFHRLTNVAYPNIALTYVYDNRNNLYKINTNNNTKTIWELTSTLPDGRTKTTTYGNGYVRTKTYDDNLQLEGINDYRNANTSYALNYNYEYELTTGNLLSRTCNKFSLSESFQYDNLYRLTGITRGTLVQNIAYAANGNINNKFDAGAYLYETSKPHAVSSNRYQSSLTPSLIPAEMSETQLVDIYTSFDKIQSLRHLTTLGVNNLDLSYGVNQERIEMQIQTNSIQTALVQYINTANMEIVNGTEITYIYADGNPIAMHRKTGGESVFYYLHTDVLGSLLAITDVDGIVTEERNFDAWGRARNPSTWNYLPANPFGSGSLTMRGYTFHEHLNMFGLINMNGRMYDPVLGRMLSSDNIVPDATSTQGFNRYSYVLNNPLKYIDPDGNEPITIAAILVGMAYGAMIGAGTAGAVYTSTSLTNNNFNASDLGKSMLFGAVGGAIGGGLGAGFAGSAFGHSLGFNILNNMASNTATNLAFGNQITPGSLFGSAVGGVIGAGIGNFSGVTGNAFKNIIAEVGFGAAKGAVTGGIGGGIGAAIDGGDVGEGIINGAKNGAISGATLASLNIGIMGAAYKPSRSYGDFGRNGPVYRRGTFISRALSGQGSGITLGRNIVAHRINGFFEDKNGNIIDTDKFNQYLEGHETGHFSQQIKMGFGNFYGRVSSEYIKYGFYNSYCTPGSLEWNADIYSFKRMTDNIYYRR